MKYWNKSKERKPFWTKVEGPALWRGEDAKRWCQQNPSIGRFYTGKTSFSTSPDTGEIIMDPRIWYFEDPQDALAFKIYWG